MRSAQAKVIEHLKYIFLKSNINTLIKNEVIEVNIKSAKRGKCCSSNLLDQLTWKYLVETVSIMPVGRSLRKSLLDRVSLFLGWFQSGLMFSLTDLRLPGYLWWVRARTSGRGSKPPLTWTCQPCWGDQMLWVGEEDPWHSERSGICHEEIRIWITSLSLAVILGYSLIS